ncbi:MAG: hypothetical protein H6510_11535 [Acidobacteria bacterium]|nr:hypothetical protein [Acidobacteriota bacterium]MCB9398437.1 hypothetical protein [Acidobacteriota bacterium]
MRLKFLPGSELGPPFLLGEIVDLDRPQHVVANVMIQDEQVEIKIIIPLEDQQVEEVHAFASEIEPENVRRVQVSEIIRYTTRRKSMC